MRVLDLGITGLDLALGGGIRLLERVRGEGESTTLLIRGPAGSGKTVLGTQLAANIARRLETDVAYGCVELLPVELRAQHESIRGPSAADGDQLRERLGPGLVYSISKHHVMPSAEATEDLEVVGLDTTWSGSEFLEHLWAMIRQQRESEKQPSRIIIGIAEGCSQEEGLQ